MVRCPGISSRACRYKLRDWAMDEKHTMMLTDVFDRLAHSLFVARTRASDSGLQSSGQSWLFLHSTADLCSFSARNTMCRARA